MIKSMTGYGRAEEAKDGQKIVVELKSVNHRFLEVIFRSPLAISSFEIEMKRRIAEKIKRGRIEVLIFWEAENAGEPAKVLNLEAARSYFGALTKLKEELGLTGEIDLKTMMAFRDIFSPPAQAEIGEDVSNKVSNVLETALDKMIKMRQEEGAAIFSDMVQRIDSMKEIIEKISSRSSQVVLEYQRRLAERVKELAAGYALDEARLAQEVAVMAEKSDITEEVVRMMSHLSQLKTLMQSDDAEGKRIDFLLQEMNREINTVGSKSCDAEVARQVIEAKSELSKLREQAQNIE